MGASKVPGLSAINDDPMRTALSASLMISAEASQPWSTIGFDQWIGTSKWWLLRAQFELRTITEPEQSVAPAAYANLIKACWILIDVIPCHPQLPFISASKSFELQSLSAEVKKEFSRITALAMVVPALDELRSQNLRIWECVPVKAPLPRPYKVSQNLDAWRIDGGEEVLFRRFAFRKVMTSVTTSPCILLLLVHESAKAARLIAQDQYGDIFMATSFQEHVECRYDGQFVTVDEEKFVLDHLQEVQVLCTMIKATNFYIVGRQADHASLEDLKAYMLLTALKNVAGLAVEQIQQEISKMDSIGESNQKGRLTRLALLMASQWIKESHLDYRKYYKSEFRLLSWAVVHNHTALIEYILSEDPVIVSSYEDYGVLLKLSTHYGSATLVRWCLSNNIRLRRLDVTSSAYGAIRCGHANVLALVINAGADISEHLAQEALQSSLSELVIHAILAMAYATEPGSESSLRRAADRGHEGAIVLLSYALTMEEVDEKGFPSRTHNSGCFDQVVAALARLPNILPAFDLTLMTVERRRTQVLLKVVDLPPWLDTRVYLDSYHAYVENVPEGLSETHKKVIKIGTNGEFQITIVHQEKSLRFTVWNKPDPGHDFSRKHFRFGRRRTHVETFTFNTIEERRLEIPIKIDMENPASVFRLDKEYTSLDVAPQYVLHHDVA